MPITITHTHADGTILTGSRKGDGVWEIVKNHGFRYSRDVGIYIRGSRDQDAQRWRIDAAANALRERGREVIVDIDDTWRPAAEREAARSDRAEERADRLDERAGLAAGRRDARQAAANRTLDGIPLGQPMMPGHHSYKADRNRRERAWNNMDRALQEDRHAGHLAGRAAGVRANDAAKDNPRAIMRRIERLQAEQRQLQRTLTDIQDRPGRDSYRERVQRDLDRITEDITHQQAKLAQRAATGEFVAWGPDNLAKGDAVRVGQFGWYRVTRVNRKSVSLDSDRWPQRITFDEIFGRRRDGLQWDAPNGEPWPVDLAVKVARWAQHVRRAAAAGYDAEAQVHAMHVRWAQRLVHGLDLTASDAEARAFTPAEDDPRTVADRRRLAAAYLGVLERLEAGERVPDIVASLDVDEHEPEWRMPAGDPVDRHPQHLHEGDIIAGVWDHGPSGRTLWPYFAGPVGNVSDVEHRRERGDWVTVTLTDTSSREFQTHQWLAVHCPHSSEPAARPPAEPSGAACAEDPAPSAAT
ncbi:DUF3560 domain-containing protein [Dactylosporangium sp. CA-233914]|uniref:DUF3560 domain-containing protein n=1 Tax=Dactylosporangium sp. CA-233914 TaxID=3239934 RepID=UPI003D9391E5